MSIFHITDQDKDNETYTNSVQYSETLYVRPEGIIQIADYLYDLLGCKEPQTKPLIKNFLEEIILLDKELQRIKEWECLNQLI